MFWFITIIITAIVGIIVWKVKIGEGLIPYSIYVGFICVLAYFIFLA